MISSGASIALSTQGWDADLTRLLCVSRILNFKYRIRTAHFVLGLEKCMECKGLSAEKSALRVADHQKILRAECGNSWFVLS